jgi:hypothetical protein
MQTKHPPNPLLLAMTCQVGCVLKKPGRKLNLSRQSLPAQKIGNLQMRQKNLLRLKSLRPLPPHQLWKSSLLPSRRQRRLRQSRNPNQSR